MKLQKKVPSPSTGEGRVGVEIGFFHTFGGSGGISVRVVVRGKIPDTSASLLIYEQLSESNQSRTEQSRKSETIAIF